MTERDTSRKQGRVAPSARSGAVAQGLHRAHVGGGIEQIGSAPSLVPSLELVGTRREQMALAGFPAQLNGTGWDSLGRAGRSIQTTQIYEGTNQIQRMVISKQLGL